MSKFTNDDWACNCCDMCKSTERERIIKLLQELKQFWSEKVKFEYGIVDAINVDEAIALIRGENN